MLEKDFKEIINNIKDDIRNIQIIGNIILF